MSARSTPSNASSSSRGVPRVGGIRCYWALCCLDPGSRFDLLFVHPDPVLSVHMAAQKMSFLGRSLLSFIHPAEREQARSDLASAIAADDLQGSVTRVRFARLGQIRRLLGASEDDIEKPFDAQTFVEDDEYLILDLVLNWVADGLLLAFFHAIRDKDPVANNDPARRNDEWTNYCGTASIGDDQILALSQSISHYLPFMPQSRYPPSRVFQIHTASMSPLEPHTLTFSWPPPRHSDSDSILDGSYDAEEYSNLMRGVDMDPNQLPATPIEQRTNCTTRFGARHTVTSEGLFRQITSVFIPYGNLIFSCYQTTKQVELQQRLPEHVTHAGPTQSGQDGVTQEAMLGYGYVPPQQDWARINEMPNEWNQSNYTMPFPQTPSSLSYSHPSQSPYIEDPLFSPTFLQESAAYPAPSGDRDGPRLDLSSSMSSARRSTSATTASSSSRPLIRPPGDVQCCRLCATTESPEWRRSESGIKDLCNACGLRLARQVAKREGRQKPRKRKEHDA
ncbi:hypothetical protein BD324DRAFT_358459 [Kockovaella imperatae]|uniref:GATA-type domain-containing protein n=1 Tax=Kockovaella imperatae TaxID=4999 RepID=A0A1Y1ULS0_9TREE|nr:hypothetical protein BD324DRAFT_358459 [Kockovaella imperatae]ORX38454.1 hypothetical protein BD324DRAFT_358459 [Kockovaella imperatae]